MTIEAKPLVDHLEYRARVEDGGLLAQAKASGICYRSIMRWQKPGATMRFTTADESAIKLGLHPAEIWDDWYVTH